MKNKREFKNVKVDKETFDKIAHIAKALGKKKAQLVREIFEALNEQLGSLKSANLKLLKHPMRRIIIFEFHGRQKLFLDKILTIKAKVKSNE